MVLAYFTRAMRSYLKMTLLDAVLALSPSVGVTVTLALRTPIGATTSIDRPSADVYSRTVVPNITVPMVPKPVPVMVTVSPMAPLASNWHWPGYRFQPGAIGAQKRCAPRPDPDGSPVDARARRMPHVTVGMTL